MVKYSQKLGAHEITYEAETVDELMELYNKKNRKENKPTVTLIQDGSVLKKNITVEEFEDELKKSKIDNFIISINKKS